MFVFSEVAPRPDRVPSVSSLTSSSVCSRVFCTVKSLGIQQWFQEWSPRRPHGDPMLCLPRDATVFNLGKHL